MQKVFSTSELTEKLGTHSEFTDLPNLEKIQGELSWKVDGDTVSLFPRFNYPSNSAADNQRYFELSLKKFGL